jgi:Zn-finger nucleic acid-binding protein
MSKTGDLRSPVSNAFLDEVTVGDVVLHKDPETGGYWLRFVELQSLTDMQDTHIDEVFTGETVTAHHGRHCPEDGTELLEFEFQEHSGVKLDICPKCKGIWLDAGELTALLGYMDKQKFAPHIAETEHVDFGERVMLFLYQLTARPPLV